MIEGFSGGITIADKMITTNIDLNTLPLNSVASYYGTVNGEGTVLTIGATDIGSVTAAVGLQLELYAVSGYNNLEYRWFKPNTSQKWVTIIDENNIDDYMSESYSTLSPVATPLNTRSANFSNKVEGGKQYYNDEDGKVVSEYEGFTPVKNETNILSTKPMTFVGPHVLMENTDVEGDYYIYTLKYMQISETHYVIAVSVKTYSATEELVPAEIVKKQDNITNSETE